VQAAPSFSLLFLPERIFMRPGKNLTRVPDFSGFISKMDTQIMRSAQREI